MIYVIFPTNFPILSKLPWKTEKLHFVEWKQLYLMFSCCLCISRTFSQLHFMPLVYSLLSAALQTSFQYFTVPFFMALYFARRPPNDLKSILLEDHNKKLFCIQCSHCKKIQQGPIIDVLKSSSNFYHLIVSMIEVFPENFSLIAKFRVT